MWCIPTAKALLIKAVKRDGAQTPIKMLISYSDNTHKCSICALSNTASVTVELTTDGHPEFHFITLLNFVCL